MVSDPIFTQTIKLPYSAIGANGRVRMDRLFNYFQDAASHHCDTLGISGIDMAKKQLKWVVSRYRVRIHKSPKWLDPLELKTWRRPWKNLYELRQASIINQANEEVISALGIWVLVKANNCKPVRLNRHLPEELLIPADPCPELEKNDHNLSSFDHESEFKIRANELDLNQHVNNTIYCQWAMEGLPPEFLSKFTPVSCIVSFLKESFYPGKILSCIKIQNASDTPITLHSIFSRETKVKLANLTMEWEKI
jgi:medium-chain acyl-[acyl-carrier-protein] hydrolase